MGKMKINLLSDLHLDLTNTYKPENSDADVIVLAGDIADGANGILLAREAWPEQEIVYVPGNHEFYRHDRVLMLDEMRKVAKRHGVYLLDGQSHDRLFFFSGHVILGCTLWTDFCLYGESQKRNALNRGYMSLNDFYRIKENGQAFTPERSTELHQKAVAWLKNHLNFEYVEDAWKEAVASSCKMIVVSHHAPSMKSVSEQYKDNLLTACFASNLDELVSKADLWLHGHTHNSADYRIGKARVVSNPRGYEKYGRIENEEFNPGLVIEI
jgi:predicted phosphodiesterase